MVISLNNFAEMVVGVLVWIVLLSRVRVTLNCVLTRHEVITHSLWKNLLNIIECLLTNIRIFHQITNKTTHVEVWDFSISEFAQAHSLVFECYPGFKRNVVLPREYLK